MLDIMHALAALDLQNLANVLFLAAALILVGGIVVEWVESEPEPDDAYGDWLRSEFDRG